MIVPLHAANPGPMTGAGNWTYFLPGRHPLLVDAGVGNDEHLDALAAARAEGPAHVVVTHAHSDHVKGAPVIAARWPVTRFSKLPGSEDPAAVSWQLLAHGAVIPAGDEHVEVVHTPGHALDHIALWHAASRTLFSGDLVSRENTVVIPASRGGNLQQYLASLQHVIDLQPARLLPAHGPAIDDPVALLGAYISHRLLREQQIVAALRQRPQTVVDLVAQMYSGLDERLLPMARESVLAHLVKLEAEQRAGHTDDTWQLS